MKVKWSCEASQDLRACHNIDAELELFKIMEKEITDEINKEIIEDLGFSSEQIRGAIEQTKEKQQIKKYRSIDSEWEITMLDG